MNTELSELLVRYPNKRRINQSVQIISNGTESLVLKELSPHFSETKEEINNNIWIKHLFDTYQGDMSNFSKPIQIYYSHNKVSIISEFIKGQRLTSYLKNSKIQVSQLHQILIDISAAIEILEINGSQHMDLYSDNIIIRDDLKDDSKLKPIIVDYGAMIRPAFVYKGNFMPSSNLLGRNINDITKSPDQVLGYGMYTLILRSFLDYSFYPDELRDMKLDPKFKLDVSRYLDYSKYLKSILDFNGLAFTANIRGDLSSYSDIPDSYGIRDLPKKKQLEYTKIAVYNAKDIKLFLEVFTDQLVYNKL